jgi:4-amino-4-deoxy-L-arabinose transferase-like glycosyltransferase
MASGVAARTAGLLSPRAERLCALGLLALVCLLAVYNLERYPRTWFDEGWWLQIPKNLALSGEYASRSAEGFRRSDTIISASPAFFLPVAGAFSLFGVGLLQARLVIAALFVLASGLVYGVTRRAFGVPAAILAVVLFVFIKPDDDMTSALVLGRQYMAEIPALCALLAGIWAWLGIEETAHPRRRAAAAGLGLGLTMAIKSQFAAPLWATLALLALVDWMVNRERRLAVFVTAGVTSALVVGGHALAVYWWLSPEQLAEFLGDYRATGQAVAGAVFSPQARLSAAQFFARSEYSWLVLAATAVAWRPVLRRERVAIGPAILWVFVTVWLGWFALASVGWSRYAFPALAIGHILLARLLLDVAAVDTTSGTDAPRATRWHGLRRAAVAVLVLAAIVGTGRSVVTGIATTSDADAAGMSAYLDTHVPTSDHVETWEWEVVFLSRTTTFHLPPTRVLPPLMAQKQLAQRAAVADYAVDPATSRYLLVGPFAEWTTFYTTQVPDRERTVVHRAGRYTLYRLDASADHRAARLLTSER